MNPVLVVGGGPAGLSAAGELSELGASVLLVERTGRLGGNPERWRYSVLVPGLKPMEEVLGPLVRRVEANPRVELCLSRHVTTVVPRGRGFRVGLTHDGVVELRDVSAAVLATGFEHFDPRRKFEYGYGRYPDVLDFKEFEGMLRDDRILRPSDGTLPRRIAWVLCVGSRDVQVGNPYCCRVGCAVSIKQAVEVRRRHPEVEAYVFYMDVRTYGLWEGLYWSSMDQYGVQFIRARLGSVTLTEGGRQLLATAEDTLLHRPTEIPFDMIVLATGMEPGEGTAEVAELFHLPVGPEGFLAPGSAETNPIESGSPGIFLAGAATGPKTIADSITEGMAAALRAYTYARE